MRKTLLLVMLLVLPGVLAHVDDTDPAHNSTTHVDAQLGPGAAGSNDFSRVNPFLLASQGRWGFAAVFAALWVVLLLGVWQLFELVLGRLIE